jgi:hypothetical protein
LYEEGGAGAGLIEAVHCEEGFARGRIRGRKGAIGLKTAVQAERNEQRLADDIQMRESAPFQLHDRLPGRRPEGPPQAEGLPHKISVTPMKMV